MAFLFMARRMRCPNWPFQTRHAAWAWRPCALPCDTRGLLDGNRVMAPVTGLHAQPHPLKR